VEDEEEALSQARFWLKQASVVAQRVSSSQPAEPTV